jgi:hypothetical protein
VALVPLALVWASQASADGPPTLAWERPVRCIEGPDRRTLRVQCEKDAGGQRCLVAPNVSVYNDEPLERVQPCATNEPQRAYQALVKSGARLVPAIAEAPPGYARSENGRAFQVKFDLLNRFYIGAGWMPTVLDRRGFTLPSNFPFGRATAELGIHLSVLSPRGRSRHDIRILEGSAAFADLELRGTLFAYDYQHEHRRPAFWLSTFFGEPHVYPVFPRLGWGMRLLSVQDRPPNRRDTLDIEAGEFHLALNPWQSDDMYSRLRIEVGGDVGEHWADRSLAAKGPSSGNFYVGPTAAIESRVTLGEGGLHYLFSELTFRRPTLLGGDHAGASVNRFTASVAYEGVLVAINDQPISVRLGAAGITQNDFDRDVRSVELRFTAGLRMSFWAPPRVFEKMPDYEEP